ncbi:hypothetical protein OE88DRAFT_729322 [Heliocybe sulcata]|uniref:Uncharacterized protein n=1 Tax=Heliocybe sulcata TaxID=5364 RepID=A0A5C3NHB9_9AGAM|nr:hypothetical protein OE88DRAFT_729322 [Heliocybe sulcata]
MPCLHAVDRTRGFSPTRSMHRIGNNTRLDTPGISSIIVRIIQGPTNTLRTTAEELLSWQIVLMQDMPSARRRASWSRIKCFSETTRSRDCNRASRGRCSEPNSRVAADRDGCQYVDGSVPRVIGYGSAGNMVLHCTAYGRLVTQRIARLGGPLLDAGQHLGAIQRKGPQPVLNRRPMAPHPEAVSALATESRPCIMAACIPRPEATVRHIDKTTRMQDACLHHANPSGPSHGAPGSLAFLTISFSSPVMCAKTTTTLSSYGRIIGSTDR